MARQTSFAFATACLVASGFASIAGCRYLLGLSERTDGEGATPVGVVPVQDAAQADANSGVPPWVTEPLALLGYPNRPRSCRERPLNGGVPQTILDGGSALGADFSCGPAQNDDCCAVIPMDGGLFYVSDQTVMSADAGGDADASSLAPVVSSVDAGTLFVNAFALDKYEVTSGRFKVFMNAGGGFQEHAPANADGKILAGGGDTGLQGTGWQGPLQGQGQGTLGTGWGKNLDESTGSLLTNISLVASTDIRSQSFFSLGNEALPVGGVFWYTAFAFCIWDGGRLPTEAEWLYAAAGGSEQRIYPWSQDGNSAEVDPSRASYCFDTNYTGAKGEAATQAADDKCKTNGTLSIPGSFPAGNGRFGHADLGGNMAEWMFDYSADPPFCRTKNGGQTQECAASSVPNGNISRVVRGGSYLFPPLLMQNSHRDTGQPGAGYLVIGFRCARDINPLAIPKDAGAGAH